MTVIVVPSDSPAAIALLRFVAKTVDDSGAYQIDGIYEKSVNDKYGVRGKKKTFRWKLAPDTRITFAWEEGEVAVYRKVEEKVVGCGDLGPKKFDSTYVESANLPRKALKRLLVHCFEKHEKHSTQKMVSLKIYNGTFWDSRGLLPKRHPDTVFLPKKDITELDQMLEKFIQDKEIYYKYHWPYKLVVLLEGLPGTGKTSLAYTVASKYERDLYVLPITNDTDDYALNNALASIAPGSILVLEDIDSLFPPENVLIKPRITLSGITNALNGLSQIDNLWTFLTSNNNERLPAVLVRDGRVDYRIHFDFIQPPEVEGMVRMFFEEKSDDPDLPRLIKTLAERAQKKKLVSATCLAFLFKLRDESAATILTHLDKLSPTASQTESSMYN